MKNIINDYNQFYFTNDTKNYPIGLLNGKIGLCIYWYIQSRCFNNNEYEEKAEKFLDSVYEELPRNLQKLSFEEGVIGVGFAIDWLLTHKFVEGDKNEILSDLDNLIFRELYFEHIDNKSKQISIQLDEIWAAIYLSRRIRQDHLSTDKDFMFKRIIIDVVNRISVNMESLIHNEPVFFAPLTYIYLIVLLFMNEVFKCGFYNCKIKLILKEWENDIISTIPSNNGHMYLIHYFLSCLLELNPSERFVRYIKLLESNINVEYFLNTELLSKNVTIFSGASLFALFAYNNGTLNKEILDNINKKIYDSAVWTDWKNNKGKESRLVKYGLLDGLCGTIATYEIINELWKK